MKQNTYFFFLLLLLTTSALEAQSKASHEGNTPDENVASWQQYVPTEGDHVANEAIMSFDEVQTNEQKQAIERRLLKEGNFTIKEWSPSSKYVLLGVKRNIDPCDYRGTGNPDTEVTGTGDQISLNYQMGTDSWDDSQGIRDCSAVTFDPVAGLFSFDPGEYSPTGFCSDDASITPDMHLRTTARVAIIDSGVRGVGAVGWVNDVSVIQQVIPDDCSVLSCDPYAPSVEESQGFNSHGASITTLITGWFRAYNMHERLRIRSYKVLDSELKCNVFQVVKAIEMATAARSHIISLSIGFIPCTKPTTGPGPGHDIEPSGGKSKTKNSILYNAIKAAEDQGVIVITSAGNNGVNLDTFPQYPAAEVGLNNLVTVGALECGTNQRAQFSNYSENHVDLFTTGNRVQVISALCFVDVNGTSFATPIVAAKAAFHVTTQSSFLPVNYETVLCQLRGQSTPFPGAKYGIVDTEAPLQSCTKSFVPTAEKPGRDVVDTYDQRARALISPNPFNGRLTVKMPEGEATITILDAQGAKVYLKETVQESTTLDLGSLKAGVYWLNIRSVSGSETQKIIKQ